MKKLFLLLFTMSCGMVYAQHYPAKHSLALVVSPDHSFIIRQGNYLKVYPELSVGYRVRADYFLQLSPRLYLKTGLGFAQINIREFINGSDLQWPSQNNGNGQFDPLLPGETGKFHLRSSAQFVQVPLGVRYYLSMHKTHWIIDLETGVMLRTEHFQTNGLQPYMGLATGIEINLTPAISFSLQPAYRVHLRSDYSSDFNDTRAFFNSVGLETGLHVRL